MRRLIIFCCVVGIITYLLSSTPKPKQQAQYIPAPVITNNAAADHVVQPKDNNIITVDNLHKFIDEPAPIRPQYGMYMPIITPPVLQDPNSINYTVEQAAWYDANRPVIWIHITAKDCAPCMLVKRLMRSPEVVKMSRNFACVLLEVDSVSEPSARMKDYGIPEKSKFPADIFVSPNRAGIYRPRGSVQSVQDMVVRLQLALNYWQ